MLQFWRNGASALVRGSLSCTYDFNVAIAALHPVKESISIDTPSQVGRRGAPMPGARPGKPQAVYSQDQNQELAEPPKSVAPERPQATAVRYGLHTQVCCVFVLLLFETIDSDSPYCILGHLGLAGMAPGGPWGPQAQNH